MDPHDISVESQVSTVTPDMDNLPQEAKTIVEKYKSNVAGWQKKANEEKQRSTAYEQRLIAYEAEKVTADRNYYLELFEKDPEIADKVAKHFGVESAEVAVANVRSSGEKTPKTDAFDKEQMFKEFKERLDRDNAIQSASSMFDGLSDEQKEFAQGEYQKLVGGRKVSSQEANRIAEMVTLYARKDQLQADAKDKAIRSLSSTSFGGVSPQKAPSGEVEGAADLAKALGLGHLYSK